MSAKIRPATIDDIPHIVGMAQRFYPESGYEAIYGPMADVSAAGLAIITMETGVMLVAEDGDALVGMVCMHVDHFIFNIAKRVAHELVFWIDPEHRRGRLALNLLKAADAAAAARGADVNRMALLASSPDQAALLYERMGYVPSERYYTKRV